MTISINSLVPAFHTCVPSWWLQGDAGSDNKHTHTKLQRIYAINVIIIIIAIIISVFVTVNDCYCVLKLLLVVLHPACINFTLNVAHWSPADLIHFPQISSDQLMPRFQCWTFLKFYRLHLSVAKSKAPKTWNPGTQSHCYLPQDKFWRNLQNSDFVLELCFLFRRKP